MKYLHGSSIEFHGLLRSGNCLIDGRWILKISDFGIMNLNRLLKIKPYPKKITDYMFIAPEHLRKGYRKSLMIGSTAGDVYSFSMIAAEIISRQPIVQLYGNESQPEKTIEKVRQRHHFPHRPIISKPDDVPMEALKLIQRCWTEHPIERPTFRTIFDAMKKFVEKG